MKDHILSGSHKIDITYHKSMNMIIFNPVFLPGRWDLGTHNTGDLILGNCGLPRGSDGHAQLWRGVKHLNTYIPSCRQYLSMSGEKRDVLSAGLRKSLPGRSIISYSRLDNLLFQPYTFVR